MVTIFLFFPLIQKKMSNKIFYINMHPLIIYQSAPSILRIDDVMEYMLVKFS